MFFIKNHNFRDFQENPSLLPFDRFPKSWETPHFLGCEICYWQQDVSKDPKRWIRRKIIRFFVSDCQWEKVLFADFDIQNSRILQLYEFVWDEKCFWILCLKCVVQGTEQYHCSGYRRRINNILKRYHGDKLSLLQLCSCTGRAPSWGRWSSSSEFPKASSSLGKAVPSYSRRCIAQSTLCNCKNKTRCFGSKLQRFPTSKTVRKIIIFFEKLWKINEKRIWAHMSFAKRW